MCIMNELNVFHQQKVENNCELEETSDLKNLLNICNYPHILQCQYIKYIPTILDELQISRVQVRISVNRMNE